MPQELDWTYYDSVTSGTTASATLTFFAQSESATNKQTTNMPSAGKLNSSESIVVHEIIAYCESDTEHADLIKLYDKAVLEFLVSNNRILVAPLLLFAPENYLHSIASTLNQAATVGVSMPSGKGFVLKNPITIPGGTPFSVKVKIGEGSTPTASDIKVCLRGILRRG